MKRITAVTRPFIGVFSTTGARFPLSSIEAQRLIDHYPVSRATAYRVVLEGHDGDTYITPATLGGGAAFIIERI